MTTIRKPAVAGFFYPGNPDELTSELNEFLSRAASPDVKEPGGIIVPHAGYTYSGLTAAYAYSLLEGRSYDTVIVLSPSHREYFSGISIYEGDAYETPLGVIEVDQEKADALMDGSSVIERGSMGHHAEHALEVQLPFLQRALTSFRIVPVVMGDQHRRYIELLADRLAEVIDNKTLLVASSDLSHFHSKAEAHQLDSRIADAVENFDPEALMQRLESGAAEACGGGLMAALMIACREAGFDKSTLLHRSDSGEVTGDTGEVVGYLSAAIHR